MTAGIVIEGVRKTYRGGSVRALDQVSLSIAPGETFGIIGPNGAGKTTLLGCLLGFLRPDAGRITVDGHEPDHLEVRRGTGYLPERLVMDRWMSGRDFLAYHHELAGLPAEQRAHEVSRVLEVVQLDAEAAGRTVRKYSRGMLQRLGLAQALLGEPRFVFLDEPASGVDPAGVVLFRRILSGLKGRGATVVLNSHQLEQVERVCDRVAFVNKGHVDAIETLSAGATMAHGLIVRWVTGSEPPAPGRLATAAAEAGATLRHQAPGEAHFTVPDDAGAARLVKALVAAGVAVTSVVPEESRLERLFTSAPAGGTG